MPVIPSVPTAPAQARQPFYELGDRGSIPRGLEAVWEFNGLIMNDRRRPDRFFIESIDGIDDADVRDDREDNPDRDGDTPFNPLYGGRTITITGQVEAGSMNKLRAMSQAIRTAFIDLSVDLPLLARWNDLYEDWVDPFALGDWMTDEGDPETISQSPGSITPEIPEIVRISSVIRTYSDFFAAVSFSTSTTLGSGSSQGWSFVFKRIGTFDYMRVWISGDGNLSVQRLDSTGSAGAPTTLATAPFTPSVSTRYWLTVETVGADGILMLYSSDPSSGSPTPAVALDFGLDDLVFDGKFSQGVDGAPGFEWRNTDWTVFPIDIQNLAEPDAILNCRKSGSFKMTEQQVDGRIVRPFQVILRAGDPNFYSRRTIVNSITPSSLNQLGEVFNEQFDNSFSSYMDDNYAPIGDTEGNIIFLTNLGNRPAPMTIVYEGQMRNPALQNIDTGERLRLETDTSTGITLDTGKKIAVDDYGNNVFNAIDDGSSMLKVPPGTSAYQLFVDSYSGEPTVTIYHQHAWG